MGYTFLQTGGGVPLVSQQEVLQTAGIPSPALVFNLGFVTDEVPAPNTLLDSFTVTLQDPASSNVAVLVTMDASGTKWAPPSPGAIPLTDSQIQRQPLTPPSLQPIQGRGTAFSVVVPLPAQFTGPNLDVYFDLYDNLNPVMSLGWFNGLQVISSVPEPSEWLMAALGLITLLLGARRKQ